MKLINMNLGDMSLIEMSFAAAVMILAIIVVRALAINKLPKKVFVMLWDVVLLRLLVPFSIPSVFSAYTFVKRSEPIREVINEVPAVSVIAQMVEIQTNAGVNIGTSAVVHSPSPDISPWMILWSIGLVLCVAFFTVSYVRCHMEFRTSIPVRNEFTVRWLRCHRLKRTIQIRQSDRISAPLTYGILKPVILMPKKTDWENRKQLKYVLMHEYTHICRFDMVTKLIAALALCIHWFNPFVWAMYILFNRDIELSCDESVVRSFGENAKSFYARTLITMEEKKSGLTPLYNSFSRNAIEERITAIMKTKRITIGILVVSILVIAAIVIPFATSAKDSEEEKQSADESVVKQESIQDETGEMEIGMVSEAVSVTGTPLEMAKEAVSEHFTKMQENGYVNWRIDSLTEEYKYGPNEEQSLEQIKVSVYQLDYCFLTEDPDAITLAGGMTIDEDGWVTPEYPGSTYLCVVADGGALSYIVLTENDCVPGDEVFTADLKQLLGVGPETAEDYYSMVTSASAKEVEQFAAGIKEDVLFKDWKSLSAKLAYPIQIGGKTINSSKEFLNMDIDGMLSQEFVNAIDAESCREMFFNYQGIMMGETGQIWIASVDNGVGQWELKVIALNGLLGKVSLERVMDRIAGQGLEQAIGYEKGYIGLEKDVVIKLCTSKSGKYEAYGMISPEYGQRGILLNNIIDGEGNWNYFDSDWGYGKKTPEIQETDSYGILFSYYREDGSWCELIFDTYETGTMSVREEVEESKETEIGFGLDSESKLTKASGVPGSVQVDSAEISSIVVINGNTGDRKTLTTEDANLYSDLIKLYMQLDFTAQYEENSRVGYQYSMILQDADGNKLQSVTPYKDGVTADRIFFQYDNTKAGDDVAASLKLMEYLESIFGA